MHESKVAVVPEEPPVLVMSVGFEGGSLHVGHDPAAGNYWFTVWPMPPSFRGRFALLSFAAPGMIGLKVSSHPWPVTVL